MNNEIVEIAKHGDFILVVVPKKAKFRVASATLKAASPYFAGLFDPYFSEDLDTRKEIQIHEKNLHALTIILNCIHLRFDRFPERLEPDELLALAIVVDQFDFTGFFSKLSSHWFTAYRNNFSTIPKLVILATAAYKLENAMAFRHLTAGLVLKQMGKFNELPIAKDVGDNLPVELCTILELKRTHLQMSILKLLFGNLTSGENRDISAVHCTCRGRPNIVYSYLEQLSSHGLTPDSLPNIPLEDAFSNIVEMEYPSEDFDHDREKRCVDKRTLTFRRKIVLAQVEVLKDSAGLCLGCVRGDKGGNCHVCELQ